MQKTHAGGEIFDIFKMIYRRLVFLSEEKKPGCVVAIIAHPRDARLYALAAKKLGLYVIIPDTSEIGYDPLSDRWWTSNAIAFTVYEISERLYALFAGKI
ncbi:MAG: hypothetical protein HGB08_01610 [Candidatus Moranbacteria bacterium]|nr:hypothetical protein [Candidatus Moranbacteria bacterium]